MLTIAFADRGRPTLKDDERFGNGLVRDLKTIKPNMLYYTLNLKISGTLSYQNSVNVSKTGYKASSAVYKFLFLCKKATYPFSKLLIFNSCDSWC